MWRNQKDLRGSPSLQAPRACYQVECINSVAVWLVAVPLGGGGNFACQKGWWLGIGTVPLEYKVGDVAALEIDAGGFETSFSEDR